MNGTSRFRADEMWSWVKHQYVMGPRRAGSPAGRRNEDFICAKLQEFGLESVRKEPIPVTHWEVDKASVELHEDSGRAGPRQAFRADA